MNNQPNKDQVEFQKQTREVFHKIHLDQLNVPTQKARTLGLTTTRFLGVPDDFFRGKLCLEAGCGTFAPATQNMLAGGAAKVHAVDLTDTIFQKIPEILKGEEDRYELSVGSVLDLKFPDGFFDFALCDGVLQSTGDIKRGLLELCRVVKPGGTLYFTTRGLGGLMNEIETLIRNHYEADDEWRHMIDELDAGDFEKVFTWIGQEMARHGDDFASRIPLELFRQMFDADMVLTIKDRIQAPVYEEFAEQEALNLLKTNGFENIVRVAEYTKFNNARRFLAPFYLETTNKISRMLYGEGYLQFRADKRK
ncbi:MAG: class I SAM-dependent methyltransferase [Rhodospirillaceae bacterium]|jgi:ubiquinone/menaquinone biosynthesis C-methylase UbiE|nr:class I SAM-dependent methyltransferase [Rhodospirillaceae bacterium]